ncbi:MAG: mechanosensitive ion channel family protein [Burkholderiales bacterium]
MRTRAYLAVLLLAFCATTPPLAAGADKPAPAVEATPATPAAAIVTQSAPVVIANRTVIDLRGPIAGYTAKERATSAIERIEAALDADPRAEVSYGEYEDGVHVRVGGRSGFIITRIDVDEQAGVTPMIMARETVKRLDQAIVERREQSSPRYLALAAAAAVAATLVYAAIVWLLLFGARWIGHHISKAADEKVRHLQIGNVRQLVRGLVTLAAWVLGAAASIVWLAFVLERFPYTRRWGEELSHNLVHIVTDVALSIAGALPGLVFVAVIVVLARAVIGMTRVFFLRVEFGRIEVPWLDGDTVRPTRRIFNFIVWVFALAMAYPYLPGAQTDAFKGLSVLLGLMLSLGGASVIGQAFSGLILMYSRVFRHGDFVRIGDVEGTVVYLGMFATRIRTGLGEEVTLANAGIMAAVTKNYSRAIDGTGYVLDTVVTIGYSTPWRQVEAMLLEAARRTEGIAQDPAPFVRQTALSDYYVEYRLVAYSPLEQPVPRVEALGRLHGNIQDVFNEYGVQIMSPHYVLDPKEPQVVPKERWFAAPAAPPASPQKPAA